MPPVSEFMTSAAFTIGPDQTLSSAHHVMREHQIRHLPVVHEGRIVGIVSQRDLHVIETLQDVDPDEVTVDDAMSEDVVMVAPEAPLDEVAAMMVERRLGSVVVVRDDHLQGIFTTTDALVALTTILRRITA